VSVANAVKLDSSTGLLIVIVSSVGVDTFVVAIEFPSTVSNVSELVGEAAGIVTGSWLPNSVVVADVLCSTVVDVISAKPVTEVDVVTDSVSASDVSHVVCMPFGLISVTLFTSDILDIPKAEVTVDVSLSILLIMSVLDRASIEIEVGPWLSLLVVVIDGILVISGFDRNDELLVVEIWLSKLFVVIE
jgi:hypothetical protein